MLKKKTIERFIYVVSITMISIILASAYEGYHTQKVMDEDVQIAEKMTKHVQNYLEKHPDATLSAPEIRTVIRRAEHQTFQTRSPDNAFWFDISSQKIVVRPAYHTYVEPPEPGEQLEEIISGYLLLATTGSDVASAINTIRNLRHEIEYSHPVTGALQLLTQQGLEDHALKFSLDRTMFINNFGITTKVFEQVSPDNIIFSDGIEIIPENAFVPYVHILPDEIRIPMTIRVIESNAFNHPDFDSTLTYDCLDEINLELNVFHPNHTRNITLYNKQGYLSLLDIRIGFSGISVVTRYYNEPDGETYIGKIITDGSSMHHFYNGDDTFVGSYDGFSYYDTSGVNVTSGSAYESLVRLASNFSVTSHLEIQYDQNLSLSIPKGSYPEEIGFFSFQTNYRRVGSQTHIEVIAYDYSGNIIAKGLLIRTGIIFGDNIFDEYGPPTFE